MTTKPVKNTDGCKIPCLAVEFEAWNWVRAAATGKFLQNNVFLKTAHQLRDSFFGNIYRTQRKANYQHIENKHKRFFFLFFLKRESQ